MQDRHYVLDGKNIKPVSFGEWAVWFDQSEHRVVARTHLTPKWRVSTVFLGLDHRYGEGAPIVFETMIFPETRGINWQSRYSTWEEAVAGHEKALVWLRRCLVHRLKKNKRWRSKHDVLPTREMPAYALSPEQKKLQEYLDREIASMPVVGPIPHGDSVMTLRNVE